MTYRPGQITARKQPPRTARPPLLSARLAALALAGGLLVAWSIARMKGVL